MDYRNELTAHRDLNHVTRAHPSFDLALIAANFYDEQLRSKIEEDTSLKTEGTPLLDEFKERLSAFTDQAAKATAAINRGL